MTTRTLRWRNAGGRGLEHLVLTIAPPAVEGNSVVISGEHDRAWSYRLVCDGRWRARSLSIAEIGGPRRLELTSDGQGGWHRGDAAVPALEGAIDIDLSASPFTNTLPIRRLGLAIGRSAEIVTAYVAFPDLTVQPDPQRYTRLAEQTWLYESLDSDFAQEISVDEDGLVLAYPGLFVREVG